MWDITTRLLCVSQGIFLWSVIIVLCYTAPHVNVWTHPSLHAFVYMCRRGQSRRCRFKTVKLQERLQMMCVFEMCALRNDLLRNFTMQHLSLWESDILIWRKGEAGSLSTKVSWNMQCFFACKKHKKPCRRLHILWFTYRQIQLF